MSDQTPPPKSSRKRSASDRMRYAERNGYDDYDETIDDSTVHRKLRPNTTEQYEVQMQLWREFEAAQPGRRPHDLKTLKQFANLLKSSTRGLLDPDGKPTVQTIRNYMRCFTSEWSREHPMDPIPESTRKSATNYILNELDLSKAARVKSYLTIENYLLLERQLWEADGHEYVHDGSRVNFSGKLKCHVFTPARIGEVSESSGRRNTGDGLRYKDTTFLVGWHEEKPELRFALKREHAKGLHDKDGLKPTHILYEFLPEQPLVVQPLVFVLPNLIARRALKHYHTIDEVLAVRPPPDQRYWVFEWSDDILNEPVFPEMTSCGFSGKIQTATAFNTQLRDLSLRAGMKQPPTIHSGRRESLILATGNGYPKDELMKFAAHTNQGTLPRDYLSSICAVDGLASFLKLPLRSDHAEDFRSMTVQRNPELLLALPAKEQDEMRHSKEWLEVEHRLDELDRECELGKTERSSEEFKDRRSRLLEQRRQLVRSKLKERRAAQERTHPSRREKLNLDERRSRFARLRHMMPERDALSVSLFYTAPLRSEIGVSVMRNLLTLLETPSEVAYQLALRPRGDECPTCATQLSRIDVDRRWKHVFDCAQAAQQKSTGYAEFCFLCNSWVTKQKDWEPHCQEHIDSDRLPSRCDFVRFRKAVACPGLCLTCMHNPHLPATRRLKYFMKKASWQKHVNGCFTEYLENLGEGDVISCPSPNCAWEGMDEKAAWYHLRDAHSYPDQREASSTSRGAKSFTFHEVNPEVQPKKRVKIAAEMHQTQSASLLVADCEASYSRLSQEPSAAATDLCQPLIGVARSSSNIAADSGKPPIQVDTQFLAAETQADLFKTHGIVGGPLNGIALKGLPTSDIPMELMDPGMWEVHPNQEMAQDQADDEHEKMITQPAAINEEGDQWFVDKVLAKSKREGYVKYLIKWMGFGDEDNTWEPTSNVSPLLVKRFMSEYRKQKGNFQGIKLLDRQVISEKTQYLIRWQGLSDSEDSWEKEDTISPHLIAEFLSRTAVVSEKRLRGGLD